MPLSPGATFGRYKILALLGQGGMGVVYRAHDTHLDRTVALKVLHVSEAVRGDGDSGAARLLREGRAAAAILHPNAVAIFDVGEWEETTFLAMELVEGRTLRGYVGDSRVPLGRRIKWLVDIASALSAAHKRGVVHRDVKPENVIVREDKEVKVLDFGIARRAPAGVPIVTGENVPRDSTVFGSPRYMAPEQLRGEPLDGNTDQFAWGVLAYELLTGRHPWEGATTDAQLAKTIFHREPVAPSVRNALIPKAIDEAVLRAIAKAPSARFASIEAAAARLKKAAGELDQREEDAQEEPAENASAAASPAEGMRSVTTRTFGITAVFAPVGSARKRVVQASFVALLGLAITGVVVIRYRASLTRYPLGDSSVGGEPSAPSEPASIARASSTVSAVPQIVTIRVDVRPPTARLVIDGVPQSTDGGVAEISGPVGTSKTIVIDDGERQASRAITFSNEAHAEPEIIELSPRTLATSQPAAHKPSALRNASQAGMPSPPPPSASAPTPAVVPTINTTW